MRRIFVYLKQWVLRDRKIIAFSLAVGLLFTISFGALSQSYAEKTVSDLANGVIRFHVRANSDADSDQNLKMTIRDAVLEEYQDSLADTDNLSDTREFLRSNLDTIQTFVEQEIREEGFDYPAVVTLANEYFPTKSYGNVIFPAGEYEALRIDIGEAEGSNWWCIMFPPLCFVDVTNPAMSNDSLRQLANIFSDEEYKLVTSNQPQTDPDIKIKFKIIEWWQNRKAKDNGVYMITENQTGR